VRKLFNPVAQIVQSGTHGAIRRVRHLEIFEPVGNPEQGFVDRGVRGHDCGVDNFINQDKGGDPVVRAEPAPKGARVRVNLKYPVAETNLVAGTDRGQDQEALENLIILHWIKMFVVFR